MAAGHNRNTGEEIRVFLAVLIIDILHASPDYLRGITIKVCCTRIEILLAFGGYSLSADEW
ncbi:hypothetical protein D3C74_493960 [compost metagenome]